MNIIFVTSRCSLNMMKHNQLQDDRSIWPQKGSKIKVQLEKLNECVTKISQKSTGYV